MIAIIATITALHLDVIGSGLGLLLDEAGLLQRLRRARRRWRWHLWKWNSRCNICREWSGNGSCTNENERALHCDIQTGSFTVTQKKKKKRKANSNRSAPKSINEAEHSRGWGRFFELVYCRRRPEETMWRAKEIKQERKLCRMFKRERDTHTADKWAPRQRGEKQQSRRVGGWCAAVTSNIVWFDGSDDKVPGSRLHVIPTPPGNYQSLTRQSNSIPPRCARKWTGICYRASREKRTCWRIIKKKKL